MSKTYAIADLHGRFDLLEMALACIAERAQPPATLSSPEWSRYLHDQLGVPLKPERINELVVAALLDQYRHRLPLLPGAVVAVRGLADRWPLGLASSANRPVIDA